MKKFMKVSAIIALVLIVVGMVMATIAGAIQGPATIGRIVESVTNGRISANFDHINDWGIELREEILSEILSEVHEEGHFSIEDSTIFDDAYNVLAGNVDAHSVGVVGTENDRIGKIEIEAGGCHFFIEESQDSQVYVEASNTGKFQCYIENNTLYVRAIRNANYRNWSDYGKCSITLFLPADYKYSEFNVEFGAGLLEIDNILANDVELEVGAGQLLVSYLEADSLDASVGMGDLQIDNMTVGSFSGEIGVGQLMVNGSIGRDAAIECSMGNAQLDLAGRYEDFNYTLEASMGNVDIGHNSYSGIAREQNIHNNAGKDMALTCEMGNISVFFTN